MRSPLIIFAALVGLLVSGSSAFVLPTGPRGLARVWQSASQQPRASGVYGQGLTVRWNSGNPEDNDKAADLAAQGKLEKSEAAKKEEEAQGKAPAASSQAQDSSSSQGQSQEKAQPSANKSE